MAPEIAVITIGYFSGIRPGLEKGLNRTGDGESGKRGWLRLAERNENYYSIM